MTTAIWRAEELAVLETRPIWRKRVTIFGRSIPLAVVLFLLVGATALASFLGTSLLGSISVVGGSDPYPASAVTITGAASGGIVDASPVQGFDAVAGFSGNTFTADLSDASPGDYLYVHLNLLADAGNPAALRLNDVPASPWPGVTLSYDPTEMQCNGSIGIGAIQNVRLGFTVDAIDVDEVLASSPIELVFTEASPSCP